MALRKHGWVSRPLATRPVVKEVYCPECFAEYGWGELETA